VVLFMHVIKTGGSSVECAATDLVTSGRWVNMGHQMNHSDVEYCIDKCTFGGKRPIVVMSVRNPYAYYTSLYKFAYAGAMFPSTRLSFGLFMEHYVFNVAPTPRAHRRYAQSDFIRHACGFPCKYDYLLHTEALDEDWQHLRTSESLSLPRKMPVNNTARFLRGVPPLITFTASMLQRINAIDSILFDEFNYTRRTEPFNVSANSSRA